MPTRLVATDLDGTLLRSDGSVSERTARALRAAQDAGVVVVFVTGRPLRWAREVFGHVGGHGLAVLSNGGLVWDVGADAPALVRGLDPEPGLEVVRLIRTAAPGAAFAVETAAGIGLEPHFLERVPVPDGARRGPIADVYDEPAVKLLARDEGAAEREFLAVATQAVGERAVVTWSSPGDTLLEISAPGVTKATTLELLCGRLGVERADVVALGDMPNDAAMLAWAGTSYAMANAHPDVVGVADRVAPSNDEDGVAQVLEALL